MSSKENIYAYIWPSFLLILFPGLALAQAGDSPASHEIDLGDILTAVTAFLIGVIIPQVQSIFSFILAKVTFKNYLEAIIENTLRTFGDENSIEFVVTNCLHCRPNWLEKLENANLGVPELLWQLHLAVQEAENRLDGFFPIIQYVGPDASELDHEHVIWKFKRELSFNIARFYVSRKQVSDSIAGLYSEPFFKFITGTDEEKKRWVMGAYTAIEDLALHYVDAKRIEAQIKKV